ncbi:hypothetical protein KIN20_011737 [Parelaphostrongylus tenuis]|uniref:Uncharacterized protein n=1 Tax=Parelaphostrongylus tenuis TaxID=148309 RepID=A0AAD5MU29_PARTN|nr:hypothetical protein KIN20_011737 [Parelaphostrongylus tenuis]
MRVEVTLRDVDLKKSEYGRDIMNLKTNADVIEEEMKVVDLENRNCELEAEIESVKAQLSAKTRELEIAKMRFQENMQRNLAQAKGDGAQDLIQEKGKQGQRRRRKQLTFEDDKIECAEEKERNKQSQWRKEYPVSMSFGKGDSSHKR